MRVVDSNKSRILFTMCHEDKFYWHFRVLRLYYDWQHLQEISCKGAVECSKYFNPVERDFFWLHCILTSFSDQMWTATCWNHSGVSWEHREMCEELVPTCIKLYWSVFRRIAFVLSSILQEFQLRSVESRANYFNVHIIFLGMWSDQYSSFVFSQVSCNCSWQRS